jgi:hypothetical protein
MIPADQVNAVRFVELALEGTRSLCELRWHRGRRSRARDSRSGPATRWPTSTTCRSPPVRRPGSRTCGSPSRSRSCGRSWTSDDPPRWSRWSRRVVLENPYCERVWCAPMLALYRLGRQAEALEAALDLRVGLADGLGLGPVTRCPPAAGADPHAEPGTGSPGACATVKFSGRGARGGRARARGRDERSRTVRGPGGTGRHGQYSGAE